MVLAEPLCAYIIFLDNYGSIFCTGRDCVQEVKAALCGCALEMVGIATGVCLLAFILHITKLILVVNVTVA